jgi:hypothetical protein
LQLLRGCHYRRNKAPNAQIRDRKLQPLQVIKKELDWFKDSELELLSKPFKDWAEEEWEVAISYSLKSQREAKKGKEVVDLEAPEAVLTPQIVAQPAAPDNNSVLQQILEELRTLKQDSAELKRDVAELKKERAPPSESEPDSGYNFADDNPLLPSPPTESTQDQQPQPTSPFVVPEGRSTLRKKKRKTPVVQEEPAKKPKSSSESEEGIEEPVDEDKEEQEGLISPPRLAKGGRTTPEFVKKVWDFYAETKEKSTEKKLPDNKIATLFAADIEDLVKKEQHETSARDILRFSTGRKHSKAYLKKSNNPYLKARYIEKFGTE